jgi:hypothetical protein
VCLLVPAGPADNGEGHASSTKIAKPDHAQGIDHAFRKWVAGLESHQGIKVGLVNEYLEQCAMEHQRAELISIFVDQRPGR